MIILQSMIYGIGNPITKIAYESITPFWCLAFRFVLAFLLLAVITGRKAITELRVAPLRDWLPGALCMAGAYITCNIALNMAAATTVGFLMSLPVLFVPIFAKLVLHRSFHRAFLPAQLAATAGLYFLCSSGGSFSFGWGELLGIIVAVFVAGALVWTEKSLLNLSAVTITLTQIAVTMVLSIAGAIIFERGTNLSTVRPAAWWVIVYLSVLCSCLSYFLQNIALAHIPSSLVSLTQCSEPIFTAAASFIILGERLSGFGWLGAAMLIACIVYGNFIEKKLDIVIT
jgi:drug/metabolite transporter (DMT)-like permease